MAFAHGPDDDDYEPSNQDLADITGVDLDELETAHDDARDDYDQDR